MKLNLSTTAEALQAGKYVLNLYKMKICALFLTPALEKKVDNLTKKLGDSDEVLKKLQRLDTTVCATHAYFNTFLEN